MACRGIFFIATAGSFRSAPSRSLRISSSKAAIFLSRASIFQLLHTVQDRERLSIIPGTSTKFGDLRLAADFADRTKGPFAAVHESLLALPGHEAASTTRKPGRFEPQVNPQNRQTGRRDRGPWCYSKREGGTPCPIRTPCRRAQARFRFTTHLYHRSWNDRFYSATEVVAGARSGSSRNPPTGTPSLICLRVASAKPCSLACSETASRP